MKHRWTYIFLLASAIFCLSALAGFIRSAHACSDASVKAVGTAKVVLKRMGKKKVKVCFNVNLARSFGKKPKYIGFKYSRYFKSSSSQTSKAIKLVGGPAARGYVRAFHFKKGQTFCLILRGTSVNITTYIKNSKRSDNNYESAFNTVSWKQGKQGVTVGIQYLSGFSGFRSSCGGGSIAWKTMQKKPVKATSSDF